MQHHKYSLTELDNMLPWERQLYIDMLMRHIEEENETKPVAFILAAQEAEGTKKIFGLSPYILAALEFGGTLIIDEFDAKMHPHLTRKIVELFHSPSTNLNNAQLVFITHDSNLLDPHLLRRDQICFVQKDKNGATELYSLVEFKGVRNDASFEKDYLQGKYRAVPTNLNQLEALFENH
jgi:AAA15 family ATPase/GTPase